MRCVRSVVLAFFALGALSFPAKPQANPPGPPQENAASPRAPIAVPAGTSVSLGLTSPVWTRTAKPGDAIYAVTAFPVAIDNQIAIPPGTYVSGAIDGLIKPGRFSNHAEFRIHFTKLIFANGYTVLLDNTTTTADLQVQVAFNSDILLDNGTQIDMNLGSALSLDADRVTAANRLSRPPQLAQFKSASRCVPTPGTSGTSPTVIPGTPGTSGTPPTVIHTGPGIPDTVIPGNPPTVIHSGPGIPDTVIPGSPSTPGTPPTVIPGTSATPGTVCPGPPVVLPRARTPQASHSRSFDILTPMQLAGKQLTPGTYSASWTGLGPITQVDIVHGGKLVVRAQARVVTLAEKTPVGEVRTRNNPDGSISLSAVQFAGDTLALSFPD